MIYCGFVIFIIILLGIYSYLSEKSSWNNGICKQTGKQWEYFDSDSQGGHGFKSEEYVIWISWLGIIN